MATYRNGGGAPPECSTTAVDGVDGGKPSTPVVTYRDMFLRWIWLGCACSCRVLVQCSIRTSSGAGAQQQATLFAAQVGWLWWPHCPHSAFPKGALCNMLTSCSAARLSRSVACVLCRRQPPCSGRVAPSGACRSQVIFCVCFVYSSQCDHVVTSTRRAYEGPAWGAHFMVAPQRVATQGSLSSASLSLKVPARGPRAADIRGEAAVGHEHGVPGAAGARAVPAWPDVHAGGRQRRAQPAAYPAAGCAHETAGCRTNGMGSFWQSILYARFAVWDLMPGAGRWWQPCWGPQGLIAQMGIARVLVTQARAGWRRGGPQPGSLPPGG